MLKFSTRADFKQAFAQYAGNRRQQAIFASVTLQSFTYDANGNRLSNGTNAYTYLANSNLMATRKGIAITRDAAGNHTNNGLGQTYTWDTQGHYTQFSLNGVKKATYLYNYQHQRVQKNLWNGTTNLGATLYHYDLAGRLLAETNTAGTVQTVYLYDNNGTPLAIVQAANSANIVEYLQDKDDPKGFYLSSDLITALAHLNADMDIDIVHDLKH